MKLFVVSCALLLLTSAFALADNTTPAQTPTNNRAYEITINHYQGSCSQSYSEIATDNYYIVSDGLIGYSVPDTNDSQYWPEILIEDVWAELATPWGAGRWEGHSGSSGLAVCMFGWSQSHYVLMNAWYDSYIASGYSGKVYKGVSPTQGHYSVGARWSAVQNWANPQQAILEVTGCHTANGGHWPGTAATFAVNDTIHKSEEAADTNEMWGCLDREDGIEVAWTGEADFDCDFLELQPGGDGNYQISPTLGCWYGDGWNVPDEGRGFTWWFDGTVEPNMAAADAFYIIGPAYILESAWDVNGSGYATLTAKIAKPPHIESGISIVTIKKDCVRSANCSSIFMKEGRSFEVLLRDNSAAAVTSFGVIAGEARWSVDWVINSDHWVVKGDSSGTWVPVGSLSVDQHENGQYRLQVGSEYPGYGLYEIDADGRERFYLRDVPASAVAQVVEETLPSRSELVDLHETVNQQSLQRKGGAASFDPEYTTVVFCPGFQVDEYEDYYEDWYENYCWFRNFEVIVHDVDSFPSSPAEFIERMLLEIAAYYDDGIRRFQLGGMANWYEQYGKPWEDDLWEAIRQYFINKGLEGDSELDDIPTFYFWTDLTTSPDYSLEYFVPFSTSDDPYIDLDNDEMPDDGVVIGRIPIHNEEHLMSYLLKVHTEQARGYPLSDNSQVVMLGGNVNHLSTGDGDRVFDAVSDIVANLPGEADISLFWESDHPYDSQRNDEVCEFIGTNRPHYVAQLSSTSWRGAPGNNFMTGNLANPFHMGMYWPDCTHPLFISGSCGTADLVRGWDPVEGAPVWYGMLTDPNRGPDSWLGNVVGSFNDINKDIVQEVLLALLADNGIRPMAEVIAEVKRELYLAYQNNRDSLASLRGLTFFGDINHISMNGDVVTSVNDGPPKPCDVSLDNHPNPFNPSTTFSFSTTGQGKTTLRIYNLKGSLVRTLINEDLPANWYEVRWDGDDDHGRQVSSGSYLARLITTKDQISIKMMLVK
jgi:hypothetical protein